MDARNRSLHQWIQRVRTGQVQLPRFQRFEAWGSRQVADLLQTVLDGLPAGAVLILEIGDKAPFHHRPLEGAPDPTDRMTELLLDGQQRLTALFRSLTDNYPDQTFFVDVRDVDDDDDGQRDYRVRSQGRWWRGSVRYPVWCDEPRQTYERGLIPVRLLMPADETTYRAWANAATGGDPAKQLDLERQISDLRNRVSQFNLAYLALPVGSSETVVLNVFVKMNTSSAPLTAFDIIVARVEEEAGESLHDLVASLDGQVPKLRRYITPSDYVLPVAAFLQGRRPTQRELVFMDFQKLVGEWDLIVRGAQRLVEFLEEESIPDRERLPSEVVLPPLGALWAHAPDSPDQLGSVRTLLRSYLWRAFATTRYEVSAAGNAFQDFVPLLEAVQAGRHEASAPIFDLDLQSEEEIYLAGWPKRRDRLGRTTLAVSFRAGAIDIADGARISPDNIGKREYHHLFPVAYLRDQGIDETRASVALNCALITWRTNRTISAKPPIAYLKDRTDAAALGEDEVRYRLTSHAIDFDELAAGDFEAFLRNRAATIARALEQLTQGSNWP